MRTLYVTDLDGTLMRDDKTISNESVAILNRLFSQGIFLTYATARSLSSASEITKSISFNLPVIIRNGTILADPQSKKEIEISKFGEELQNIRRALADASIPGFATAYFGSNEVKLCMAGRTNEGFQDYLQNHSADRRIHMVDTEDKLYEGETCYFTFIAPKNELQPLYEHSANDISMFQMADEAYATQNAIDELKEIAT